jgi:hypothetical protein
MRYRCTKPSNQSYKRYGGRGISVCGEWSTSFLPFKKWALANGYEEHLTIDRINNDGNYEPSNCRWATMQTQSENKSNNKFVEIDGVTKTLKAWADHAGVPFRNVYFRYAIGIRGKALLDPERLPGRSGYATKLEIDGVSKPIKDWADQTGIPLRTLYYRYNNGVTGSAIIEPTKPGGNSFSHKRGTS